LEDENIGEPQIYVQKSRSEQRFRESSLSHKVNSCEKASEDKGRWKSSLMEGVLKVL
jgi:hypothetical protein